MWVLTAIARWTLRGALIVTFAVRAVVPLAALGPWSGWHLRDQLAAWAEDFPRSSIIVEQGE